MRNLYAKLGARSRAEAVESARAPVSRPAARGGTSVSPHPHRRLGGRHSDGPVPDFPGQAEMFRARHKPSVLTGRDAGDR
jgi:hypothetical protein